MRARVRAAVAALRYEHDILAQSLRRGSTWTIGFVISNIANPLFAEIAIGAERDVSQVRLLKQRRVDGLILSLSTTVAELKRLDLPFVLLDRADARHPERELRALGPCKKRRDFCSQHWPASPRVEIVLPVEFRLGASCAPLRPTR